MLKKDFDGSILIAETRCGNREWPCFGLEACEDVHSNRSGAVSIFSWVGLRGSLFDQVRENPVDLRARPQMQFLELPRISW